MMQFHPGLLAGPAAFSSFIGAPCQGAPDMFAQPLLAQHGGLMPPQAGYGQYATLPAAFTVPSSAPVAQRLHPFDITGAPFSGATDNSGYLDAAAAASPGQPNGVQQAMQQGFSQQHMGLQELRAGPYGAPQVQGLHMAQLERPMHPGLLGGIPGSAPPESAWHQVAASAPFPGPMAGLVPTTQMPGMDPMAPPMPFGLLPPSLMGQPGQAGMALTATHSPVTQAPQMAGVTLQPHLMAQPQMPNLSVPMPSLHLIPQQVYGASTPPTQHGSPMHMPPMAPSVGPIVEDSKKEKRKQSNRDSARRSRLRKMAESEELGVCVEQLEMTSHELHERLGKLTAASSSLEAHNDVLRRGISLLEKKQALPEELIKQEEVAAVELTRCCAGLMEVTPRGGRQDDDRHDQEETEEEGSSDDEHSAGQDAGRGGGAKHGRQDHGGVHNSGHGASGGTVRQQSGHGHVTSPAKSSARAEPSDPSGCHRAASSSRPSSPAGPTDLAQMAHGGSVDKALPKGASRAAAAAAPACQGNVTCTQALPVQAPGQPQHSHVPCSTTGAGAGGHALPAKLAAAPTSPKKRSSAAADVPSSDGRGAGRPSGTHAHARTSSHAKAPAPYHAASEPSRLGLPATAHGVAQSVEGCAGLSSPTMAHLLHIESASGGPHQANGTASTCAGSGASLTDSASPWAASGPAAATLQDWQGWAGGAGGAGGMGHHQHSQMHGADTGSDRHSGGVHKLDPSGSLQGSMSQAHSHMERQGLDRSTSAHSQQLNAQHMHGVAEPEQQQLQLQHVNNKCEQQLQLQSMPMQQHQQHFQMSHVQQQQQRYQQQQQQGGMAMPWLMQQGLMNPASGNPAGVDACTMGPYAGSFTHPPMLPNGAGMFAGQQLLQVQQYSSLPGMSGMVIVSSPADAAGPPCLGGVPSALAGGQARTPTGEAVGWQAMQGELGSAGEESQIRNFGRMARMGGRSGNASDVDLCIAVSSGGGAMGGAGAGLTQGGSAGCGREDSASLISMGLDNTATPSDSIACGGPDMINPASGPPKSGHGAWPRLQHRLARGDSGLRSNNSGSGGRSSGDEGIMGLMSLDAAQAEFQAMDPTYGWTPEGAE